MEQADLFSALYSSHGESPRVFLAPRNISECFETTVRAFNIADRFQIPVILALDFYLSEHIENIPPFNLDVPIERGLIWNGPTEERKTFKRFEITPDGVSPRAFPPNPDSIHVLVGADHDEESHSLSGNRCGMPKSWDIREKMTAKRFRKLEQLREEMNPPLWHGTPKAKKSLICWGSLSGPAQETINQLNQNERGGWNVLSFSDIHPMPSGKVHKELNKVKHGIMLEVNYTGQLEMLIYMNTGWKPQGKSIHPISGEVPTAKYIIEALRRNGET